MAHTSERLRRFARNMRRAPTRAEGRVWAWLRARRFSHWKFRRQHPIGRFIVDFYSAELKLAIELDGSHHTAEWMIDHESGRARTLRSRDIEVLRIPNEILIRDPESVSEFLKAAMERRAAELACRAPRS
jgi:ATP-dependent helicase HrpA/adenine-specific DNA-methyltransferase